MELATSSITGGLTQKQVGKMLGVTRSRVGQIERRALRKLRKAIVAEAEARGMTPVEWVRELLPSSPDRSEIQGWMRMLES
ncbi:MAG: sigma factor-like helix-turn-helix DNA-binding protein [Pirellulales bacterium]